MRSPGLFLLLAPPSLYPFRRDFGHELVEGQVGFSFVTILTHRR